MAEAEEEEASKLAVAVDRATQAEKKASEAELALRKEAAKGQTEALRTTAGPSTSTPTGTVQPGAGKRRRGTPEDLAAEKAKKTKGATNEVIPAVRQEVFGQKAGKAQEGEWRMVEGRKKKEAKPPPAKPAPKPPSKPRRVRQKPDALVIGEAVGASYADILRKVKEDPSLQELGEKVVAVRRTQKGDLLFELKRGQGVHSADYREKVANVLGESAKVRALSQEVAIECSGMDEVTTAEDLRKAMVRDLNLEGVDMSISMRKSFNRSQAATIKLPVAAANKALQIGKVKVGWTRCALRLPIQVTRCFKCMGFDHRAHNCKGPDRSDLCRRCGAKGHMARDCSKAPKCMLCPAGANDHPTGGGKCPAFKKAKDGRRA